jgi:uncharacterized membrane protein
MNMFVKSRQRYALTWSFVLTALVLSAVCGAYTPEKLVWFGLLFVQACTSILALVFLRRCRTDYLVQEAARYRDGRMR